MCAPCGARRCSTPGSAASQRLAHPRARSALLAVASPSGTARTIWRSLSLGRARRRAARPARAAVRRRRTTRSATARPAGPSSTSAFDLRALLGSAAGTYVRREAPPCGRSSLTATAPRSGCRRAATILAVLDAEAVAAWRSARVRCSTVASIELTALPASGAACSEHIAAALAAEIARPTRWPRIELALDCADCGHRGQRPSTWSASCGRRSTPGPVGTLREVHTLARAYGWREADILALSPGAGPPTWSSWPDERLLATP